jgi:hypothetical protein
MNRGVNCCTDACTTQQQGVSWSLKGHVGPNTAFRDEVQNRALGLEEDSSRRQESYMRREQDMQEQVDLLKVR